MKALGQLVIALIGGIVAIFLYRSFEQDDTASTGYRMVNPLERKASHKTSVADSINNVFTVGFGEAAETTLQQVVHIRARIMAPVPRNPFYEFFGDDGFWRQQYKNREHQQRPLQEAAGSGVIVSPDGHIVTNNHVIDNAQEVIVSLHNGRDYKADVVGADPSTDLAVLKIDAADLPQAMLANSDAVRVGDWVLAVGNPFNLSSTVTAGIVSAKARNINILSDNSAIESFIQTDAAVNPGNSGGALVNLRGELIGINTAIATPTGTFAGYSFAVPSNIVRRVTRDLIEYGEVRRGYLGVIIRDLTWELAQDIGLDLSQGVVVVDVSRNGAAQKAGIKARDVIRQVNGTAIHNTAQLLEIIGSHKPGDVLRVGVQRDGKERDLEIRLQKAKTVQQQGTP